MLPGQGEHSLDHHVVKRHGLDQRLEVLRRPGEPVHAVVQQLVEERVELRVQVVARLRQPAVERVGLQDADLGVEAVEERDVARLVGDLRAQEDAHVLVGHGAHDRAELGGDALLAAEERAQPVHALEALVGRDPLLPVRAVLREVDLLHRPLLALPQLIELAVAQQLRVAGLQRGVGRRLEVGPLRAS